MIRHLIILLSIVIIGCERAPEHTRGDLTPYLQWTNGTPVVIHVAATKSNGEDYKAGTRTMRGILAWVAPDEVYIRADFGPPIGLDKDTVLWMEKDSPK